MTRKQIPKRVRDDDERIELKKWSELAKAYKKYDELKSLGVDIDEPKKGTTCEKYCFLRDPDGVPIELYQPKIEKL